MSIVDERKSAVARLQMLLKSEPTSVEQISDWYRSAETLKLALQSGSSEINVPHVIWHYLDDADIRFRDRAYAEDQISAVERSIEEWS